MCNLNFHNPPEGRNIITCPESSRHFFTILALLHVCDLSLFSLCAGGMQRAGPRTDATLLLVSPKWNYCSSTSNVYCLNHLNHLMEKLPIDSKTVLHKWPHFLLGFLPVNLGRYSISFSISRNKVALTVIRDFALERKYLSKVYLWTDVLCSFLHY